MAERYNFKYLPLVGKLPGKSMVEQTETAINELASVVYDNVGHVGNLAEEVKTANTNASNALDKATEALETSSRVYIKQIAAVDVNDYYDSELYYIDNDGSTNIPVRDRGFLEVKTNDDKTACEQVFIADSTGTPYYRHGRITEQTLGKETTYVVTWSSWYREQQADWKVTDPTSKAFIKNKPDVLTYEFTQPQANVHTPFKSNCIQSIAGVPSEDIPDNVYTWGVQATLGKIGSNSGGNARIYLPHRGGMYFKNCWNNDNGSGWHAVIDDKNFTSYAFGYYNSVAEMRASETALVGRPCVTLGYYAPNDGGGAVYIIRQKKESDTDDGGSVLVLDNGNVAELMVDGAINVKQFGAKGDGTADDYDAITKALHFSYLRSLWHTTDGINLVKAVSAIYFPYGSYKISKTLKITESRTHFVLDMSNCNLIYTGTDYAIEVRRLRQSTIKIGNINTSTGGGIHFVSARDKNGDKTDYYQYVKLYFNTINAQTDCIFIENRVNGWGNECQVYGGRLQKGEYGIRTFQDSTDDINHWTFYNIGFEGVQVGCLLHSEPINDNDWHSLSEHAFFQCRVEDSKIALKTEGSVQNCLWIDASFPHLDKFQFSDLTKVFKFITPFGEYYSNSLIPKNADFDDYYFAGNYNVISNDVFNTLSNRPYNGQAGKLEVSYLNEYIYHVDAPQKGYVLQKYTDITGTIWQRIKRNTTWDDWKQFPSTMEYYGRSGDDFNNNTADGVYFYVSNDMIASCTNCPTNVAGRLAVKRIFSPNNTSALRQEYYPYNTTNMYVRIKSNNTWGDWVLK